MKTFKFEYVGDEPIQANKGKVLNIWGHRFVWDGERAICEMNIEAKPVVEEEIKCGRAFKILRAAPKAKAEPAKTETATPEVK